MRHPSNTFRVTCKDCGKQWDMHWPCDGSEDEIRFGKHQCFACQKVAHQKDWEEEWKDTPEDCGRPNCLFIGQKHIHGEV